MPHCHSTEPLRFGICTDPHKDIMHDADARLTAFIEHMNREHVDFIVHLGDFCRPYDQNRGFLAIWDAFDGPRYHVLGNHDMDGGFTREQTMAYWDMPARYYSWDMGGHHFVVLDGNDQSESPATGYPRYIAPDQLEWLREDLHSTQLPTVVFSHQSLETPGGVENGAQVRAVLEEAGQGKVSACFSGHHHIDFCTELKGIHYVQVNSMSNYWMGEPYIHIRYSAEIDQEHPWIKYTAPYRDPLYALVALEPDGVIRIEGCDSEFVGPSPWDLGYPRDERQESIVPRISDRALVSPAKAAISGGNHDSH